MKMRRVPGLVALLLGACWCFPDAVQAEEAASSKEAKITFDDHIKPIFREHCTVCHNESDKESDLSLETYGSTLAGGSSGQVIVAGDPDGSRLYKLITHAERPFMPPDEDAMAKEKLDLVRKWIEQGMPENASSKIKQASAAAVAMLATTATGRPEGPPPMPESLLREPVLETPRSAAIAALAASPWAPLIALGGQQQVLLYHAETGELLGVIPFPEGEPQCLQFTRDGRQLLIGGGQHAVNGCAVLVDVATGKRIAKVGDELDIVFACDISPDKQHIALAGPQRLIRVYNTLTGELELEIKKHTDWVYALRYSPDGILLASADRSNGLLVWEADTGTLYADLRGHQSEIRSIDFHPSSNVLASSSLDGTIRLWDMLEPKQIKSWNAHGGGVHAIAYAHDGSIVSGGADRKVKLWDANGSLKKEFAGMADVVLEVAITGDAKRVAAGDLQGNSRIWAVEQPDASLAIAANPPSIETRLKTAQQRVASIQQELNTLTSAADAAQKAVEQKMSLVNQQNARLKELAQQITAAETATKQLTAQIAQQDSEIKALEAKLQSLKQAREEAAKQLAAKQQELDRLQKEKQQVTQQLAAGQEELNKLTAAAQQAAQKRDAVKAQLDQALQELKQAEADKAALDAYAQKLQEQARQSSAQLAELSQRVEAASHEREMQQTMVAELSDELGKLQAQLEELQRRVTALSAKQKEAEAVLKERTAAAEQLQAQYEAAQQAALEAEQALNLFKAAYGSDNK